MWPIGTLAEVAELGLDPATVRTCSPAGKKWLAEGEMVKDVGCEFYRRELNGVGIVDCLFAHKCPAIGKVSGGTEPFRDHGPKNVAVFIRLDNAERMPGQVVPPSAINFMPCFTFESSMRARYESQRETGEIIAIAGAEGDGQKFPQNVIVEEENPRDPRGPKVKKIERQLLPVPDFERPAKAMGDVQYARMAAAALKAESEMDIAAAMEDHVTKLIGTAPLPEYDEPKPAKGKK